MAGYYPVITPHVKELIFKHFKVEQIMTSVFHLNEVEKTRRIHYIFPECQKIFLDSGIFQLYNKNLCYDEIVKYRGKLVQLYNQLRPDLASALDIPATIWDNKSAKKERVEWSIENYKYMSEYVDKSIVLVLGVCAFSERSANVVINKIKKEIGSPSYVAIGGQVPILKIAEKAPHLAILTMKVVSTFREKLPQTKIHVFGGGGHRWYMLFRLLGANSADYAGYLYSTGTGEIVLPGIRPKYILEEVVLPTRSGKKKYRRNSGKIFSEDEMDLFYACTCPACRNNSPVILEFNKSHRLLHNFHVAYSEAKVVDKYCEENDFKGLKQHIQERLLKRDSGIKVIVRKTLEIAKEKNFDLANTLES
jgi:queuine/archaeosine tRNA-ribosyltransferase